MSFLTKLYPRYLLWRTKRILEKRLRQECGVSQLEVLPKKLTLTHYNIASNLFWDGEAYFPFWRGEIQVSICQDDEVGPSVKQLDLLRSILCHDDFIRPDVEAAVLHYYRTSVYNPISTRKSYEEVFHFTLPEVNTPAEIERLLLCGPSITIGIVRDTTHTPFDLHFGCLWDEEHGVTVEIEDWKIIRVGH